MESKDFLVNAIKNLYPGTFSITSTSTGNYEDIGWLSEDIPKPTLEEIESEIQRLEEEWKKTEYQRLRSPEYPPITEFADAMYWNSRGNSSHLEEYYRKCDEVKSKYPKL